MDLRQYAEAFSEAECDFEKSVESFGLPFEPRESSPRDARAATARRCNCACENADSSLRRGWISPACLACRTGERTATFFVDLRCTKHCYFCFNPNQDGYEYFLTHKRDIVAELEQAHAHGVSFDCLAITGGEPMLHKPEVLAFLRRARELYPQVHIRLYTSGDLLDEASLRELSEAGLDEIRFSVKPADVEAEQGGVYALMERAVALIPDVVVEVPVIPGSSEGMKAMMRRASAIGVRGINLLEFCFPLCNADEFSKRGFKLRKHPYAYLYNYWYGGGIPVAGSETEALALMDFACEENLPIGVHYCSSDNKNTGQIFQQNKPFGLDVALRARYPWLSQDPEDHFLKCAKAFGEDALAALDKLERSGEHRTELDALNLVASFPLEKAPAVREALPHAELAVSVNVLEEAEDGGVHLREVAVEPFA